MDYHQNARLTIYSREQLARAVAVERSASDPKKNICIS